MDEFYLTLKKNLHTSLYIYSNYNHGNHLMETYYFNCLGLTRVDILAAILSSIVEMGCEVSCVIHRFSQFFFNQPGVAWQAHVAGFLIGLGVTAVLRNPLQRRLRKIHAPLSY